MLIPGKLYKLNRSIYLSLEHRGGDYKVVPFFEGQILLLLKCEEVWTKYKDFPGGRIRVLNPKNGKIYHDHVMSLDVYQSFFEQIS